MTGYTLVLLAYAITLMAVGLLIGRRGITTSDFFVAGRGLGPLLLGGTVLAANIGAGSTVGAAALGYQYGLAAWWWVGSVGIGTLILAFGVGPRIWQVARDNDLLTMGDYLEWRYDASVRLLISSLLWFATLMILAAQLVAVGFVLEAVAGIPRAWGCVIGGVVMTVYFTAGGMLTSAWVNFGQLIVVWAGLWLSLGAVRNALGGTEELIAAAPAGAGDFLEVMGSGGPGWVYLFMLVPAFIISPGLVQKVYSARDARSIRVGLGCAGVLLLVFAVLPPLLGAYARILDPGLIGDNTNLALPLVLTQGVPALLGALGLAAVFSAEVSSADAVLLMLSTSLSKDLYQRFWDPEAAPATVLRVARIGALAGGVAGTVIAIAVGSVIETMTVFYSVLAVSLFVPVLGGIYWRSADTRAALGGSVAGMAGYVVGRYLLQLPGAAVLNPTTLGLIASATVFVVLGVLTMRREVRNGRS